MKIHDLALEKPAHLIQAVFLYDYHVIVGRYYEDRDCVIEDGSEIEPKRLSHVFKSDEVFWSYLSEVRDAMHEETMP